MRPRPGLPSCFVWRDGRRVVGTSPERARRNGARDRWSLAGEENELHSPCRGKDLANGPVNQTRLGSKRASLSD